MDVSVNIANSLLEQDVLAHQNICATLEHLKQALKTKSLIEKEAEATFVKNEVDKNLFFEALKKDLMNLEKSNECLKLENEDLKSSVYKMDWQVKEMNDTIADSESQLLAKDAEKEDLEKELQKEKQLRQKIDEVVQNVQSDLDKEKRLNVEKSADISNLSVECERLSLKKEELLSELLALRTRMKEMQLQNEKVKKELKIQKEEKNKIEETNKGNKEIQKFTEELKVQLTSAKGRLSRVGSVLGDGPESALRATPTLEFNE
jgi:chromosome segregation ATPase